MTTSTSVPWWEKIGEAATGGVADLVAAGFDRAATEIAPSPASQNSQIPNTHPVDQHVGRQPNGQPVTSSVSTEAKAVDMRRYMLLGGAALLAAVWFMRRK